MHDALAALARAAAATPTPTPSRSTPTLVTPGPWGFVIIALDRGRGDLAGVGHDAPHPPRARARRHPSRSWMPSSRPPRRSRRPRSTTRASTRPTTTRRADAAGRRSSRMPRRRRSARGTAGFDRDDQARRPVAEEREHRADVEDLVEPEVAGPRVRAASSRRRSRRRCRAGRRSPRGSPSRRSPRTGRQVHHRRPAEQRGRARRTASAGR